MLTTSGGSTRGPVAARLAAGAGGRGLGAISAGVAVGVVASAGGTTGVARTIGFGEGVAESAGAAKGQAVYPDWAQWDSGRLEVAQFCAAVLMALVEGGVAPAVPVGVEAETAKKLQTVRSALIDMIERYG